MSVSFSEVLLVLLVAVIVLKPEQMPDVAFKLGKWSKNLKQMLQKFRAEVDGAWQEMTDVSKDVSNKQP